jgi:ABC-2 type transport system permease protein
MNALLIARRDLSSYLHGYTGWVLAAAVLFLLGILFQTMALGSGAAYSHEVLEGFFEVGGWVFNTAAVLITMRSFSEERQLGTDVLLRTAPISSLEVVLGKFLAAVGFLAGMAALTVYLPGLIFVNGKVSVAHIAVGYSGLLLMSATVASIGIAMSSLFRSQVASAISAGILVGVFVIAWKLSDLTDPPFTDPLAYMALWDKHYTAFSEGTLRLRDVVFYLSTSFVFLFGTAQVLEGRRWQ